MNSTAIARLATRSRLSLIAAGIFVLLGSFVAPAHAGYYGYGYANGYGYGDGYGYGGCYRRYRCGYPAYRYYGGCGRCGCGGCGYRSYYGGYRSYYGCGGGCGYRRYYGCGLRCGYRAYWPQPYPWGYGGVRYWRSPFGNGYAPLVGEEVPPPPEPVYEGGDDYY